MSTKLFLLGMDIAKSVFNCDLRRTISQLGGRATEFNFPKSYCWVSLAQLLSVHRCATEASGIYGNVYPGPGGTSQLFNLN